MKAKAARSASPAMPPTMPPATLLVWVVVASSEGSEAAEVEAVPASVVVAPEPAPPVALAEIEDESHSVDDDSSDEEVEIGLEVEVVVELANVVEAKVGKRREDNSEGESVELERSEVDVAETDVDIERSGETEDDEMSVDEESDAGLLSAQDLRCFCQLGQTHKK